MKKTLIFAILLLMPGCADFKTHTEGRIINDALVKKIEPGVTTKDSVISSFGQPQEIKKKGDLEILVYTHLETKTPFYLSGLIEVKSRTAKKQSVLEIAIKDNIVKTFNFKSEEN